MAPENSVTEVNILHRQKCANILVFAEGQEYTIAKKMSKVNEFVAMQERK